MTTKRDESGHTYHFYKNMIAIYKKELADLDYQTIKYIEGALSREDFIPICVHKAELRDKISELELKIIPLLPDDAPSASDSPTDAW